MPTIARGDIPYADKPRCEKRRLSERVQPEHAWYSGNAWWQTIPDVIWAASDALQAEIEALVEQRDELLAALKRMEFAFSPLAKDSTLAGLIDEARAAIAKVKGEWT